MKIDDIKRFNQEADKRLEMGMKRYGKNNWKKIDALSELEEELLDIRNYALFTYIKVKKMGRKLK